MGYRLQTENTLGITIKNKALSKPVCYGTMQMPNADQVIVLMKDRQTIGGYPVLGNVIQTDLFRLSQMRAGQKVKFLPTSLNSAQQQLTQFYLRFNNKLN